jgi:prepilin signal peptidase PulO-like enzyme (type II secretory pathway)
METLLQDKQLILPIAALLGLLFGSFATALIYRLPREINWVSKRSACPKCNHALGILDLFPIVSYLLTLGKCRYCKAKFGYSYVFIEILMAVGFTIIVNYYGFSFNAIIICLLYFAVILILVIDFQHYIIPDEVNILIFILGVSYGIYNQLGLEQILLMPVIYFSLAMGLRYLMFFWKKKEGLGLGDVKFFLAAGTFLSIEALPTFLFISGFVGILIALLWRILKKGEAFPFGPALAISLLFCVCFPESNKNLLNFVQELLY